MPKKLFLNSNFILLLILLNAAIIFVGGFDLGGNTDFILSLIDNGITILFIVELVIKLRVFGKGYFSSRWDNLDFILILLSIPSLLAFLFNADIHDFGFLLVFRVLRVFKSFRFLKFVPGIDNLIKGLQRALKASVIVLLGFVVYIFIVGVFSFYLFKDSSLGYFNNPFISLYSIFKIFTIEGWFEIPEQITSEFSPITSFFTYVYFILVVLSGGILGLSLVNSIFVDAMVSDNNDKLEIKIDNLEIKIDRLLNQENKH